jgi:hypothetical protein
LLADNYKGRLTDGREVVALVTRGMTDNDGPFDAEPGAQVGYVVGHLLQGARLDRRPTGATLAAQVDTDDLKGVGEWVEQWLEVGVVKPRRAHAGRPASAWR